MTPNLSIPQQRSLPAFTGWQACFARMEMSVPVIYIHVAKVNRRLPAQGCYSMTD